MTEEKENGKVGLSWLSLKEVNNLLSDMELNIGERNVLKRKRGFLLEQMRQEALHSENPRDTINVILKISDEQELDVGMVDLASISVRILFLRATEHLSTDEIKLVSNVLQRTYPDGKGFGDEPWKTMFFENAGKFFPYDTDAMIKEVENAGISKEEYIDEVVRHTLLAVLHGTDEKVLANALYQHGNLIDDIGKFYGFDNLDWQEIQRLLEAADILLSGKHFSTACRVYSELDNSGFINIGDRAKIIEIQKSYNNAYESEVKKMVKLMRKVIAKSGLPITIIGK